MDVYNIYAADALVEIYDSSGKLKDIRIINGYTPPSDLLRSTYDVLREPFLWHTNIGDPRRGIEETKISNIIVPRGGKVTISKSSNLAYKYNIAMAAFELLLTLDKLKKHSSLADQTDTKKFLLGFVREIKDESLFNIFKSEGNISLFSMDLLDTNSIVKIQKRFLRYLVENPTNNPVSSAFFNVSIELGNIGTERIIDILAPGLGSFAGFVREFGDNTSGLRRLSDLYLSYRNVEKSLITLRDIPVPKLSSTTTVDARSGWTLSNVEVVPGCRVEISASGKWSNGMYTDGKKTFRVFVNAEGGNPIESGRFSYPLSNTSIGTLIAKVGTSGNPFRVGSKFISEDLRSSGKLYFSINDDFSTLQDNLGQLTVTVEHNCKKI